MTTGRSQLSGLASISGSTRVAAVIGNPVTHSMSPRIHNAAFAHTGLDWVYVAFPAMDGAEAVRAMRNLGIRGLSVTMPYKQAVASAADQRTEAVERLGSANTLYWVDDEIWADSTDGDGFVAAYGHRFARSLNGRTVAVIGAGGSAASIVEALGRAGAAEVVVVNRSLERARSVAELCPRARVGTVGDCGAADVIVNTTPVGMAGGPAPDQSPVPADLITADHDLIDIVYNPRQTPLMVEATERGASVGGGLGMLVHQAALQFERWTSTPAPIETMAEAVANPNP